MKNCKHPWKTANINEKLQKSMKNCKNQWKTAKIREKLQKSLAHQKHWPCFGEPQRYSRRGIKPTTKYKAFSARFSSLLCEVSLAFARVPGYGGEIAKRTELKQKSENAEKCRNMQKHAGKRRKTPKHAIFWRSENAEKALKNDVSDGLKTPDPWREFASCR